MVQPDLTYLGAIVLEVFTRKLICCWDSATCNVLFLTGKVANRNNFPFNLPRVIPRCEYELHKKSFIPRCLYKLQKLNSRVYSFFFLPGCSYVCICISMWYFSMLYIVCLYHCMYVCYMLIKDQSINSINHCSSIFQVSKGLGWTCPESLQKCRLYKVSAG